MKRYDLDQGLYHGGPAYMQELEDGEYVLADEADAAIRELVTALQATVATYDIAIAHVERWEYCMNQARALIAKYEEKKT